MTEQRGFVLWNTEIRAVGTWDLLHSRESVPSLFPSRSEAEEEACEEEVVVPAVRQPQGDLWTLDFTGREFGAPFEGQVAFTLQELRRQGGREDEEVARD